MDLLYTYNSECSAYQQHQEHQYNCLSVVYVPFET